MKTFSRKIAYYFFAIIIFVSMTTQNTHAMNELPIPLTPPGPEYTIPNDNTKASLVISSIETNIENPNQLVVKAYESNEGGEYALIFDDVPELLYKKLAPGMIYRHPLSELSDSREITIHPDYRGISFYKNDHVKVVMKRFDIHKNHTAMHFVAADESVLVRGFNGLIDCFEGPTVVCDPSLTVETAGEQGVKRAEVRQGGGLDINSAQYESLVLANIAPIHHSGNSKNIAGTRLDFVATFQDNRERAGHFHQGIFADGQIIQPFCDYTYIESEISGQDYEIKRICSPKGKIILWKNAIREFVASIPYRLGIIRIDI